MHDAGCLAATEHVPDDHERSSPLLVALVHGSMDRGAAFARAARHLRDLHTLRYDRRGFGRSVGCGTTDLDGHAGDLLALLDGRPSVVAGHSIGGLVALKAAESDPRTICAVGVYEAPMSWTPWWSRRSAGSAAIATRSAGDAAEAFLRRMIGDERWEAFTPAIQEQRRAEGPALVAELRSARDGPAYDLDRIRVPVLVARGSESAPHHAEAARSLAASCGTELRVCDGAGHGGHLSHPAWFAGFVREVVAAATTAAEPA